VGDASGLEVQGGCKELACDAVNRMVFHQSCPSGPAHLSHLVLLVERRHFSLEPRVDPVVSRSRRTGLELRATLAK
jgi:hypothetical protein